MTYLQPALTVLLLFTAFSLLRRRWRSVWLGLALIFLWAWPPCAYLLSGSLEWWYRGASLPSRDAQAIVVLSSGTQLANPTVPEPYVGWGTFQRCQHTSWLYHHWRQLPVFASGGPELAEVPIAHLMRTALQNQGVPSSSITIEDKSRSTYENAVFTAPILRARGIHTIALVTHAYHMLRSEKVFRKQGFDVVPAPCAAYTADMRLTIHNLLPSGYAASQNDTVLHEWVGLVCYKILGRL